MNDRNVIKQSSLSQNNATKQKVDFNYVLTLTVYVSPIFLHVINTELRKNYTTWLPGHFITIIVINLFNVDSNEIYS